MLTWVTVISVVFLLFVFLDGAYFFRGIVQYIRYITGQINGRHILEEITQNGQVSTSDIDFNMHMNNARYMRACDFGRFELWMSTGIWSAVRKLKGGVTLGASTIRYRKSLQLWDKYYLKTKILCWDEKAFYVEQQFIRCSDNFICAIAYVKQTFLKVGPAEVIKQAGTEDTQSPEIPEEIKKFIECHKISSDNLKKSM